jgi:DNA-binding protein HU-beta/DNA-binding protein HU-alpha
MGFIYDDGHRIQIIIYLPIGNTSMNKKELVAHIADTADLSQQEAIAALNATVEIITNALKDGEEVTLIGFGTFKVNPRAAREGRNPKTGDTIQIAASNAPVFKAGKALKEELNP